jgi:hypothetical protein
MVFEIGAEELDWLAQSPDLNPSNNFGMTWNADCEPGLIAHHQCPTSLMLMAEWKKTPAATLQHVEECLPRRVEAVIAAKVGPSILMPMILE